MSACSTPTTVPKPNAVSEAWPSDKWSAVGLIVFPRSRIPAQRATAAVPSASLSQRTQYQWRYLIPDPPWLSCHPHRKGGAGSVFIGEGWPAENHLFWVVTFPHGRRRLDSGLQFAWVILGRPPSRVLGRVRMIVRGLGAPCLVRSKRQGVRTYCFVS